MKPFLYFLLTCIFFPVLVAAKQPNIIVILTDDQEPETIKSLGGKVLTPNIDQLKNEGMYFTRAYVPHSICAPSRYALLTGRYASRCKDKEFLAKNPANEILRMDNTSIVLEKDRMNLPKLLKERGYTTGMVGKWHLGHHFLPKHKRKELWEEAGLQYYAKNADPKNKVVDAKLKHNQKLYQKWVQETGFDYARSVYWANLKELYNDKLNYHNIDWTVKGALDFIEMNQSKPFFLYFSTTLHHGPHPQRSVFANEKVTGEGISSDAMRVMPSRESIRERVFKAGVPPKFAYMTWLDDAVGAISDKLKQLKLDNNTLVVYMTDHRVLMKASLYENGVHIPMFIKWPEKVKANSTCDELVQSVDLTPTFCEAAGSKIPSDYVTDGMSMMSLLESKQTYSWRKSLFFEVGFARAVITKEHKLITLRHSKRLDQKIKNGEKVYYIRNKSLGILGEKNPNYFDKDQLFNLTKDPSEMKNEFNNIKLSAVKKSLQSELRNYIQGFSNHSYAEYSEKVN